MAELQLSFRIEDGVTILTISTKRASEFVAEVMIADYYKDSLERFLFDETTDEIVLYSGSSRFTITLYDTHVQILMAIDKCGGGHIKLTIPRDAALCEMKKMYKQMCCE